MTPDSQVKSDRTACTIERWECPVHGWDVGDAHRPAGSTVLSCGRYTGSPKRCQAPLSNVKYVPASELAGLRAENEYLRAENEYLRVGISWVRGMCSDEEPYAEIDQTLGEILAGSPLPTDEMGAAQ